MKLAVATCCAIALCLGSLTVRALVLRAPPAAPVAAPAPAARAAPRAIDMRVLASIDQRLHRTLRKLARSAK